MFARSVAQLVGGTVLLAGLTPSPTVAQSAVAETLFNEGRALFEQGRFDEACPKFQESDRVEPAVGTKLNLALCEESRGRTATAWALFRVVVEELPVADPRRAMAEQHRQALDPRVPHITIRLKPSAPPDTVVALAGLELSKPSFDTPLAVDPGQHEVRVRAPGHEEAILTVGVAEAQALDFEVAPGAALPALAPPPAEPASPAPASPPPAHARTTATDLGAGAPGTFTPVRIGALAVGGAGVVALITSAVFSVRASSLDQDSADLGCRVNRCPPEAAEARNDAIEAADVATVAFVAGAALVASAGVMWYLGAPAEGVRARLRLRRDGAELAFKGTLP